ncbi:MAG: hypothetical protein KDJ73_10155 [Notoacmeibacter sp.]|nr:hypothetical protein [Notoacmeibacter sp.]MCC0032964.1 hypothetical protein [Brucellaceae bacterium]
MRTALLLLAFCLSSPALAQMPEPSPLLAAIVPVEPEARACFARVYDAAHLKTHPHQTVTGMEFRLTWHVFEQEGNEPFGDYMFQMRVDRRGAKKQAHGTGPCMERDGKAFCGIECDGGGVFLKPREDGALLVSFDDMWGIRLSESCDGDEEDEDAAVPLKPGRDDRSFRLERLPDGQCPAYEDWDK